MKKSTKIILPALAAIVLGTAASVSGTVAWFAANGVVEATGMQVKCSTSKNLMIANEYPVDSDTSYGTSVSAIHDEVDELSPSSTTKALIASGAPKFFYSDSKVDVADGTLKPGAVISEGTESTHYLEYNFWLAASSLDDLDLKIQGIIVQDKDGNDVNSYISQALRFGVYYVDGTKTEDNVHSEIFRLGAGTASYYGLNKAGTVTSVSYTSSVVSSVKMGETADGEGNLTGGSEMGETVAPAAKSSIANFSLGKLLSTKEGAAVSAHTWTNIKFYFWYEGQDVACTAANALSVQELNIAVKLEANIA